MATPQRGRGRPKLGTYRLETIVPQSVLDELKRREAATGIYRTRVAAALLIEALTGDLPAGFNRQSGRVQSPPPS